MGGNRLKKTINTPNKLTVSIETSSDCNVNEAIKDSIEKALQESINKLSKDYFRTIKATVDVEIV